MKQNSKQLTLYWNIWTHNRAILYTPGPGSLKRPTCGSPVQPGPIEEGLLGVRGPNFLELMEEFGKEPSGNHGWENIWTYMKISCQIGSCLVTWVTSPPSWNPYFCHTKSSCSCLVSRLLKKLQTRGTWSSDVGCCSNWATRVHRRSHL